jgi:homoserine kinase type II
MAVYTQLSHEVIDHLVRTIYGIGALKFSLGIAQGVENSNYLVAVEDAAGMERKYILTLYEKRVVPEDVPFFLGLMQHLARRGIVCPQPVARADGTLYGMVAGKVAAMVTFLDGQSYAQIRPTHAASLGEALAGLHHAVAGFSGHRANALSFDGWKNLYTKIAPRLEEVHAGLGALLAEELAFLAAHWPEAASLPRGVIHADCFPDNVFFIGDTVSGIIDFYFACDDFFAYDLAITVNAWCFESDGRFNEEKASKLLQHYQQHRPLNTAEKTAFPILLRGAALRFLLTRAHDWLYHDKHAMVTPKDPLEYLDKLQFHQKLQHLGAYGDSVFNA